MSWGYWGGFAPYVPVAQRRAQALRHVAALKRRGKGVEPVVGVGRKIVETFWGQAWCDNLESYSDFSNRLPRGKTYLRNGSVVDLKIAAGKVTALVSGREMYTIEIAIRQLPRAAWTALKRECAGQVGSLIELLQGRLSRNVMTRVTDRRSGLFPAPREIEMKCSCPDWAGMCKHLAAVLYGVGHRLDRQPELLFTLRQVSHLELVESAVPAVTGTAKRSRTKRIAEADLGAVFGIEIEPEAATRPAPAAKAAPILKPRRVARTIAKPVVKSVAKPVAKPQPAPARKPAKLSAARRARIAALQRRRWEKIRKKAAPPKPAR